MFYYVSVALQCAIHGVTVSWMAALTTTWLCVSHHGHFPQHAQPCCCIQFCIVHDFDFVSARLCINHTLVALTSDYNLTLHWSLWPFSLSMPSLDIASNFALIVALTLCRPLWCRLCINHTLVALTLTSMFHLQICFEYIELQGK